MGLTKKQEEVIDGLLQKWHRNTEPEATAQPEFAEGLVKVLTSIVNTYNYGAEEIQVLLKSAIQRTSNLSWKQGCKDGREFERQNNTAIKSAGECVKAARDAERAALRTTLRTVFDAETSRGTNPLYAFNEALKAIE